MLERHVSFDRESHSADAIQRAAYRFSDRLSIDLRLEADSFQCSVMLLTDDSETADEIVHGFRNEVLDYVLRERIRRETEATRNAILAMAFSNTSLIAQE
jgi:His-Xaa-Ser system protein HxsD